jgi:hypothetical protein
MRDTIPSNKRTLSRIKGILRALNRGDITGTEAISAIARVVREEEAAEARRTAA